MMLALWVLALPRAWVFAEYGAASAGLFAGVRRGRAAQIVLRRLTYDAHSASDRRYGSRWR